MIDRQFVQDFLRQAGRSGVKPGLERIQALLAHVGKPHLAFRTIHVAGSNGKGSTATMIARVLQAAGWRTGLYTSPHLVHYNERIQVNALPISDAALRRYVESLHDAIGDVTEQLGAPSEFDLGTALAFLHFAQEKVDWAVIETGLGGRWDSTNVVMPELSVITHIALDHTSVLGPDVAAIAKEKAGIIKEGRGVVIGPQPDAAGNVLRIAATEKNAPLCAVVAGPSSSPAESGTVAYEVVRSDAEGGTIAINDGTGVTRQFDYPLLGAYQGENAAVAATVLHWLSKTEPRLTSEAIQSGFNMTRMPGRLEIVPGEPIVVLDGAHNELGVEMLLQSLSDLFPDRQKIFVCGFSSDKPAPAMLQALVPAAKYIVTTEAEGARLGVWPAEKMAELLKQGGYTAATAMARAEGALAYARRVAGGNDIVCIMGSLYLVGQLRATIGTWPVADRS